MCTYLGGLREERITQVLSFGMKLVYLNLSLYPNSNIGWFRSSGIFNGRLETIGFSNRICLHTLYARTNDAIRHFFFISSLYVMLDENDLIVVRAVFKVNNFFVDFKNPC